MMTGTGHFLSLVVRIKIACSPVGVSGIHDCLWYVALLFTIRQALPSSIVLYMGGIISIWILSAIAILVSPTMVNLDWPFQ